MAQIQDKKLSNMRLCIVLCFCLCGQMLYAQALGEPVNLQNHPKAKGVNIKIYPPLGWKRFEGDNPNVVAKFVNSTNTSAFGVTIGNVYGFASRKEAREHFLKNVSRDVDDFIKGMAGIGALVTILEKPKITTIDTYPALEFIVETRKANEETIDIWWQIGYEDKIITLRMSSRTIDEFIAKEPLFRAIANSVVFLDKNR